MVACREFWVIQKGPCDKSMARGNNYDTEQKEEVPLPCPTSHSGVQGRSICCKSRERFAGIVTFLFQCSLLALPLFDKITDQLVQTFYSLWHNIRTLNHK